jgi:hypothetical protein
VKKTLLTVIVLAAPRAALACPVCFGQTDSPLAKATNLGILAMLVVVAGMLASFAGFFIYLNRRQRLVERQNLASASSGVALGSADPQEGIASC